MKTYDAASLIVLLTLLGLATAAWAGNCTSPVIGWQNRFRLSGSGGPATGDAGDTYTVNEEATGIGLLDGGATSCTTATWSGSNANFTGSVTNERVHICPPPDGGQLTSTATGFAFGSTSILNIDLSTKKFTYLPVGLANLSIKTVACDGTTTFTSKPGWQIVPADWVALPTGAPHAFPLPSTIQSLSGELPPDFQGKTIWGHITIPWNLSFSASPVIDTSVDDPCEWIVGSRI
jgi:hypothetical protein